MIKRLSIVILVFLGVVFVPYFLGRMDYLHQGRPLFNISGIDNWVNGVSFYVFPICIIIVVVIFIYYGIKAIINYIKNGN